MTNTNEDYSSQIFDWNPSQEVDNDQQNADHSDAEYTIDDLFENLDKQLFSEMVENAIALESENQKFRQELEEKQNIVSEYEQLKTAYEQELQRAKELEEVTTAYVPNLEDAYKQLYEVYETVQKQHDEAASINQEMYNTLKTLKEHPDLGAFNQKAIEIWPEYRLHNELDRIITETMSVPIQSTDSRITQTPSKPFSLTDFINKSTDYMS